MDQTQLFHEDIFEATRTDVMACGGFKEVGASLWPHLSVPDAGRRLANCLNDTRQEKLDQAEALFIKKLARRLGSFAMATYEADEITIERPRVIEPEDEKARLRKEFIRAVGQLDSIKSQLGKFSGDM